MISRRQACGAVAFCAIFTLCLASDGLADAIAPANTQVAAMQSVAVTPTPSVSPAEPSAEPEDYSYIPLSRDLAEALVDACEALDVPLELTLSVIEHESGFQSDAIGPDGEDYGLFQIRESNHDWLESETGADPMTPEGNIICGVWFMAYLYDYCDGDWPAALTCWRYGPGNGETCEYAETVIQRANDWKRGVDIYDTANSGNRSH